MDAKSVAKGLGWFSIALGAAELVAGRRIARSLGAEEHSNLVRGFGVREIATGAGLLNAPAHDVRMWGRVGGDALDLAALGALISRNSATKPLAYAALGFVVGVTIVDILTASALSSSPSTDLGKTGPAASVS